MGLGGYSTFNSVPYNTGSYYTCCGSYYRYASYPATVMLYVRAPAPTPTSSATVSASLTPPITASASTTASTTSSLTLTPSQTPSSSIRGELWQLLGNASLAAAGDSGYPIALTSDAPGLTGAVISRGLFWADDFWVDFRFSLARSASSNPTTSVPANASVSPTRTVNPSTTPTLTGTASTVVDGSIGQGLSFFLSQSAIAPMAPPSSDVCDGQGYDPSVGNTLALTFASRAPPAGSGGSGSRGSPFGEVSWRYSGASSSVSAAVVLPSPLWRSGGYDVSVQYQAATGSARVSLQSVEDPSAQLNFTTADLNLASVLGCLSASTGCAARLGFTAATCASRTAAHRLLSFSYRNQRPTPSGTTTASSTPSLTPSATGPANVLGRLVEVKSIVCSESSPSGRLAVSEVVIVTLDGFNIARSSVVTSSSAYAATPASLAVDGIVEQNYPPSTGIVGNFFSASQSCSPVSPQWIRFALPFAARIMRVDVYNRGLDWCGDCQLGFLVGATVSIYSSGGVVEPPIWSGSIVDGALVHSFSPGLPSSDPSFYVHNNTDRPASSLAIGGPVYPTPSITASQTASSTGSATTTATGSLTASATQSLTASSTLTASATGSVSLTPTKTSWRIPTPSTTSTQTISPTSSVTASSTQTSSVTGTRTASVTLTPTMTSSPTKTQTPNSLSATASVTGSTSGTATLSTGATPTPSGSVIPQLWTPANNGSGLDLWIRLESFSSTASGTFIDSWPNAAPGSPYGGFTTTGTRPFVSSTAILRNGLRPIQFPTSGGMYQSAINYGSRSEFSVFYLTRVTGAARRVLQGYSNK